MQYYIAPNSTCGVGTCTLVPVITPEGLLPPVLGDMTFDPSVAEGVGDLTAALVVVFGYSQSADIATMVKSSLSHRQCGAAGKPVVVRPDRQHQPA